MVVGRLYALMHTTETAPNPRNKQEHLHTLYTNFLYPETHFLKLHYTSAVAYIQKLQGLSIIKESPDYDGRAL